MVLLVEEDILPKPVHVLTRSVVLWVEEEDLLPTLSAFK
jgi:hypothetical protein